MTLEARIAELEKDNLRTKKMMFTMFEVIASHGVFDTSVVAKLRPLYMAVRDPDELKKLGVELGKTMDEGAMK